MNRVRLSALLFCGTLFVAGFANAQQNLLVNGSFEQPAFTNDTVNFEETIPGWTSTGGFEVWNNYQGPGANGNQYIELDTNTCTTISQTIPTVSSRNYTVSLAFAARDTVADNQIQVLWNGVVIGSASANGSNLSGNSIWTRYSYTAAGAAGSSTLAIRNVDVCDGLGSLLDDVSVVEAPVPLPTLGLLGAISLAGGLMTLAFVLLRRRVA